MRNTVISHGLVWTWAEGLWRTTIVYGWTATVEQVGPRRFTYRVSTDGRHYEGTRSTWKAACGAALSTWRIARDWM